MCIWYCKYHQWEEIFANVYIFADARELNIWFGIQTSANQKCNEWNLKQVDQWLNMFEE